MGSHLPLFVLPLHRTSVFRKARKVSRRRSWTPSPERVSISPSPSRCIQDDPLTFDTLAYPLLFFVPLYLASSPSRLVRHQGSLDVRGQERRKDPCQPIPGTQCVSKPLVSHFCPRPVLTAVPSLRACLFQRTRPTPSRVESLSSPSRTLTRTRSRLSERSSSVSTRSLARAASPTSTAFVPCPIPVLLCLTAS
jgi:hypothetical protein